MHVIKRWCNFELDYFENQDLKKNSIILLLVSLSIALILILQVFWLRGSYENEVSDLRRETNTIFKNTVSQLRDSIFFSTMQPSMDSAAMIMRNGGVTIFNREITDTVYLRKRSTAVFLSAPSENDSIIALLQPITKKLRRMSKDGTQNFTIRIAADSLNLDSLKNHFKKNLLEVDITTPILVERLRLTPFHFEGTPPLPRHFEGPGEFTITIKNRSIFSDTLHTEPVSLNPGQLYVASLVDVRLTVLKKITPQILFSAFLTLLIAASFIVLYRSLKAQQRLMELKNEFISNITHELKTPVTTVGVAIEALKSFKGLDNPKLTQEYLDIAQNELNRLSILTDKILKTAIFENKGVHFKPETLEMDKLIDQVLSSMKLVFEKQHAKVQFEKLGADFHLNGGSVHLTSVVYNLLDNALKYSPVNTEISIVLEEKSDDIILTIKDNGMGIPPEFRKKVFEKFFRVPTGDVHNIKGYGLGLSYVESVIKSHKGTIELESEPGKGSSFKIRLPK